MDDRERNDALLEALKCQTGLEIKRERLEVRDYLLPNLLVERKSYCDFCESIKNGRLFRQATQLSRSSIQPLLIIEAVAPKLFKNPMPDDAVR